MIPAYKNKEQMPCYGFQSYETVMSSDSLCDKYASRVM